MRSSNNQEALNSTSFIQSAETLEEINHKTPSLRDQFAMVALQGLLARTPGAEDDEKVFAATAYILADAMLEERKS